MLNRSLSSPYDEDLGGKQPVIQVLTSIEKLQNDDIKQPVSTILRMVTLYIATIRRQINVDPSVDAGYQGIKGHMHLLADNINLRQDR